MSTAAKRMITAKELAELTRQIRNLQKRCKRAEAKAASLPPKARGHTRLTTLRCQASSNLCMMVYVLAGLHTTKVAVDFMLGSGWRRKISCKNPEITKTLESEVEDALLSAPLSALVALEVDPVTNFEFCDLLCSHKYVMEHKLHEWIVDQNINHGVAPSRDQVVAELPQCIHECAPPEIRERLCGIVRGAPQAVVGSLPEEVGLGVWDVEGAGADVCGREAAKGCFDSHYLWCSSKGRSRN